MTKRDSLRGKVSWIYKCFPRWEIFEAYQEAVFKKQLTTEQLTTALNQIRTKYPDIEILEFPTPDDENFTLTLGGEKVCEISGDAPYKDKFQEIKKFFRRVRKTVMDAANLSVANKHKNQSSSSSSPFSSSSSSVDGEDSVDLDQLQLEIERGIDFTPDSFRPRPSSSSSRPKNMPAIVIKHLAALLEENISETDNLKLRMIESTDQFVGIQDKVEELESVQKMVTHLVLLYSQQCEENTRDINHLFENSEIPRRVKKRKLSEIQEEPEA